MNKKTNIVQVYFQGIILSVLFILSMGCAEFDKKSNSNKPVTNNINKRSITFAAYGEVDFRETNFYEEDNNTIYMSIDSRGEYWLPPGENIFSWGPYIRLASVSSSGREAFANAYTALPGGGVQVYPFSHHMFKDQLKAILGPLRLFAEYNKVYIKGDENEWRPDNQTKAGFEYWRSRGLDNIDARSWHDLWIGAIWHSSNEFDDEYNTLVLSESLKIGLRKPGHRIISRFTPYLSIDASKTDNESYYWENRLISGCGLRYIPPRFLVGKINIQRFFLFAEYIWITNYFDQEAPETIPDHDFRVGLNFSIGDWFK